MKKIYFAFILVLIARLSYGQDLGDQGYNLNFDDTFELQHLTIDTISHPNNIWQIGVPQKTIFTSAYSAPNVIVTDTLNPYPINDTSVFIITNVVYGNGWTLPHTASIIGQYFVNSDTLTDYGLIEFSPDNGVTWHDILNDTSVTNNVFWYSPIPILTGNSNGWQHFYVNLAPLGSLFNIQLFDTLLYRFTFISDSIQTNKDGLMFDNLHFDDYSEGIPEIQNQNLISLSPNPVNDQLIIHRTKISDQEQIQIFDFTGRLMLDNKNFFGNIINTKSLSSGIYFLRYSDAKNFCVKKFVVNR